MLNQDYEQRVVIETSLLAWEDSPAKGVTRKKLEREDAERGRATSIVRYAAGSEFPTHKHPYGEEIFVLEGVFSDENGDYPAGTYLRNPAGSSHAPFSKQGCTLFVKLCYFDPQDNSHVIINTVQQAWLQGMVDGLQVMPLHTFATQNTALVKWSSHTRFNLHKHMGGEEILVLQGEFCDEHGRYPALSWLRNPHLSQHQPFVEEQETIILVKTGHLPI
ncbi:cupin domain-containing protein [Paraglaciecola hydrolytica]|uniref:Cupin n=1 Tax=Paraglaciecola hydrolytica TaxID=1799789 RepID=A0A148KKN8_9ALTE|nr:cupin domain-containing protein [Paraglaciecola hydrolytica]KXI26866.1 cupin [Paraglaciecola hydrolytica]